MLGHGGADGAARGAQGGGAGARIGGDLGLAGADRLGDRLEGRRRPGLARGRQVARAGRQGAAARLEEALHDPVLEAVEGDDGKAAAGREHLLGGRQPALELVKLLVHVDADRLEGARRRVLLRARLVAERLADDLGELAGPLDRPRGDDRAGDPARLGLLAIMEDDVGDLGFVGAR